MAVEKYIRGKHDNGNHDGRYSNVRRELEAEVDMIVADQLIFSLSAIRHLPQNSELYRYHKSICDFWLEPLDKRIQEVLE